MLTGKRFRLTTNTLGIEATTDGKRTAVYVPAGAIIEVTQGPSPTDSRMIDVLWEGKALVMFYADIEMRAEIPRPERHKDEAASG